MFTQIITPNPNIPCKPGWCLAYVNEAFGAPKRYGSATAAWEASPTQHTDRDFPADCWVPVWYALANEPAGHVVLLAPDGSVYSTSDLTNIPHHHPDLADLEAYYAYYGMTLTYRGWTEDVEGTPVIASSGIAAMGTITQEDELSAADVTAILDGQQKIEDVTRQFLADRINDAIQAILNGAQAQSDVTRQYLADRIKDTPPADLASQINAAGIAAQVRDELVKLIGGAK